MLNILTVNQALLGVTEVQIAFKKKARKENEMKKV